MYLPSWVADHPPNRNNNPKLSFADYAVTVKKIDPSLSATQASQIAKLMPEGAAASIGQLAAIARPS